MLKIEKKLIEFVEKYMLVLQLLLVSAIALYVRRIPIWWNTDTVMEYFNFHENCVQSYLYYLLVRGVQYLPMLPLHSIKWIAIIGDFGTAVLCLLLVREKQKENSLLQVFCFTICLFSPVMFLRGVGWAQIDSFAVMLFLLGWLLREKERNITAGLFLLLSAMLYPCMIVFVLWLLMGEAKREHTGREGLVSLIFMIVWLFSCGLMAIPLGKSFFDGLLNCFAWLTYHPVTGKCFETGLEWLTEMLIALGLPGSVMGGLALARQRRGSFGMMTATQFLLAVLYGSRMF